MNYDIFLKMLVKNVELNQNYTFLRQHAMHIMQRIHIVTRNKEQQGTDFVIGFFTIQKL